MPIVLACLILIFDPQFWTKIDRPIYWGCQHSFDAGATTNGRNFILAAESPVTQSSLSRMTCGRMRRDRDQKHPRPSCRSQVSVTSCDVGPEFGGGADACVKKLPAWLQVSGFPEFHQHRRGLGRCLEPGLSSVSTRHPRGADIGHWIVDTGQGSAGHDTISCVEHPGQGHLHTSCAHAHAPSP